MTAKSVRNCFYLFIFWGGSDQQIQRVCPSRVGSLRKKCIKGVRQDWPPPKKKQIRFCWKPMLCVPGRLQKHWEAPKQLEWTPGRQPKQKSS